MRKELLDLIGRTEEIREGFTTSGGNGIPKLKTIYKNEVFLEWKQELHFELQEIYDRLHDKFIWSVLVQLKQKFNGWSDESSFNELVGSLKAIEKNIVKYFSTSLLKPEKENSKQELLAFATKNSTEINEVVEVENSMRTLSKKPKIFISHSSANVDIVLPLVELLEGIGLGSEHLFCSSIVGYGIPMDEDIYEYLKKQFDEYDLHVIFLLSDQYYSSPACMNEMGAAWVLKNKNTMILTPGFEFHKIKGAVNPRQIGLKLDNNIDEVKEKLGGLRNVLVTEFELSNIPDVRWESKRDAFINKINALSVSLNNVPETEDSILISDIGIELLKKIGSDAGGTLIKVRTMSGTTLQTNGINMIESDERREVAKWEEAVDELIKVKFIVPIGNKGELFEMTAKGYDYLDEIMK